VHLIKKVWQSYKKIHRNKLFLLVVKPKENLIFNNMTTTAKLYTASVSSIRTWLFILAFVAGNLILPQVAHLVPDGGKALLPIYFFTLIAAYKYGIYAGLLTAILSPLANHFLFGMPPVAMLPIILIKSTLLASAAAVFAKQFNKVNILLMLAVVLSYQLVGSLAEWGMTSSFAAATQDFTLGLPGMALQVLGGFLVLKLMTR
jgi:thiamine transporter ThiT